MIRKPTTTSSEYTSIDDTSNDTASPGNGHEFNSRRYSRGMAPFPFRRLPPELRRCIWEEFCPDILGQPRVLEFRVNGHRSDRQPSTVHPDISLGKQTLQSRRVLAVHRESRALTLSALPHSLQPESKDGLAIVRFNKHLDVAMLHLVKCPFKDDRPSSNVVTALSKFQDHVVNLAVYHYEFRSPKRRATEKWLKSFSNLERLFVYRNAPLWNEDPTAEDTWYNSRDCNQYTMDTFEKHGPRECVRRVACWPNCRKTDFDVDEVFWNNSRLPPIPSKEFRDKCDMEAWPMVLIDRVTELE